jgi:glucosyl-3-phosphoglycerate synthase
MSDFFQNGSITTLHNLRSLPVEELEYKIMDYSPVRPISLILPSLYSELQGPALPKIISELKAVPYLSEIVIGLDKADKEEFKHAVKFFSMLPQQHTIIWQRGPRMKALYDMLDKKKSFRWCRRKGQKCMDGFRIYFSS